MYVNGCLWGNIYSTPGLAESWVNTADKGAIATLATSSGGIPLYLDRFATDFFEKGFQNDAFINLSIGKIHQEAIRQFYSQFNPAVYKEYNGINYSIITATQLILQGDPSIKLFDVDSYDLALLENSISASTPSGDDIFVFDDTLQFTIPIVNYGLAYDDSTCITIEKVTSTGNIILDNVCFDPVYNRDEVTFYLTNHQLEFGTNEYQITVSSQSSLTDKDLSNNSQLVKVLTSDEGFLLLYPSESDTVYELSLIHI